MTDRAALQIETASDVAVATLGGELDLFNAGSIRTRLLHAASTNGVRILVLDLSAVTYLDSSTVQLLFDVQSSCRERNASFRIVAPSGSRAHRVLALAGVTSRLSLATTVEEAAHIVDEPVDHPSGTVPSGPGSSPERGQP